MCAGMSPGDKKFEIIFTDDGEVIMNMKSYEAESPEIAKIFAGELGAKLEDVKWAPKVHIKVGNKIHHHH